MTASDRLKRHRNAGDASRSSRRSYAHLAAASHEIRTALGSIRDLTELLLATRLDQTQQGYVLALKAAGEGLLDVVDDVAELTRIGMGRLVPERAPFALRAVLDQTEILAVQKAAAKGLRFGIDVAPDVPATVTGDAGLVRRVLLGLVWNAVRHTDHGSIRVAVSVEPPPADGVALRFEVADSGVGIAADDIPRLFGGLSRDGDAGHLRRGVDGLALAVAQHLVDSMGGQIGVESSLGVGSRFWFTVPFRAVTAPEPAETHAAANPGRRLRLLVAEDNEVSRMFLATVLERAGHAVDLVTTGAKAVAMARRGCYDAILMDVRMPVMDGVEAARTIRALGGAASAVPIVALTADALAGARERFLAAGMTDYITKPIDLATLAAALGRATGTAVDLSGAPPERPTSASLVDLARRLDAFIQGGD